LNLRNWRAPEKTPPYKHLAQEIGVLDLRKSPTGVLWR
jgi:hypothetical protein